MRTHVRLVIYDCDGVLFDSLEANRRLYTDIAMKAGRGPLSEEETKYCHTHTVYESIHFLFRDHADKEEHALRVLKSIDLARYVVYLRMEPFVKETLAKLKEIGIRRAISTNRTTTMPYIMERFDLYPFFDMVVTALDVEHPKPHPESITKILRALSVEASQALFIGDSEVDRKAALSSGVRFISYKNREIEADGFIESHRDLISLLLKG
jgi:HAD superfamily hydrolase (TIGR01549 family)